MKIGVSKILKDFLLEVKMEKAVVGVQMIKSKS